MATPRMDKSLGPTGTAPGGYYGSRVPHFPDPSDPTDHASHDDWNPFATRGFGGYYGEYYGRTYSFDPAGKREVDPDHYELDEHLGYGRYHGIHQEGWGRGEKHFRGVGPLGYIRPDDLIAGEIDELMTGHPDLNACGIRLAVREGVVELRGHVPDREQKYLAEDLSYEVMGVQDVDNELRVDRPDGAKTPARR